MSEERRTRLARDPRVLLLGAVLALLAGTGAVLVVALLAHRVLG